MSRSIVFVALVAALAGPGAPACAQSHAPSVAAPDTPRPTKHAAHKAKVAKSAARQAASEPAPWAAVDPGRASGGAAAPVDATAAAVPGVRRTVQPDADRVNYGVRWTSSNAPNAGGTSTQGVLNEINHDLGAPNAIGTDAEVGVKLNF